MSTVKTYENFEKKTLKNVQKFLQNISKENQIEEKVIYKDYLKTTEDVSKKKYNTQIEEFDFYTLRRLPYDDKYIFYYDTNGYIYAKEEKKMRMIAYYDRNKKIVSFEGKSYSTLEKFIKKSFNQN
jgi:hypothetical protein